MIDISKEAHDLASWPARDRLRALQRILPRVDVEACLGPDRVACPRLPGWFLIWCVVAIGLCGRDSYRQVFRWLQPRRAGGIPPRSTLCEARKRLGVAPVRRPAESAVRLLGTPTTPGAFYRGMRTMALDGFTLDLADTPRNARVFGRPGTGRAPGAFPQARVLALCETGSHVLWRRQIKPFAVGEVTMALDFPTDGGRRVPSVSSNPGVHHADDTKDVHTRVQGRGRQARHRAGAQLRRGRTRPRHRREHAQELAASDRQGRSPGVPRQGQPARPAWRRT